MPRKRCEEAKIAKVKAAVIYEAGGPEVLTIEEVDPTRHPLHKTQGIDSDQISPISKPSPGWVPIRVKAFGLKHPNSSPGKATA